MIKTFTKDDLIRYLYHETTETETKEISNALLFDAELRSVYAELNAVKQQLDQSRLEPSASTIGNILNYARQQDKAAI